MSKQITHSQLVDLAEKVAKYEHGCRIISREPVSGRSGGERPDVYGMRDARHTYVYECKASYEDFKRDRDKAHNQSGRAIGVYRFYVVEFGLVEPHEIPEHYGLISTVEGETWVTEKSALRRNQGRDVISELAIVGQMVVNQSAHIEPDQARKSAGIKREHVVLLKAYLEDAGPVKAIAAVRAVLSGLYGKASDTQILNKLLADAKHGRLTGIVAEGTPTMLSLEERIMP